MALSTARIHRVRGRPPLLAAGITSLIHSHSSSVRSLGYIFSFIYPFYTTCADFSDRLLEGIHRVRVQVQGQIHDVIEGLNDVKSKVLRLFGDGVCRLYQLPSGSKRRSRRLTVRPLLSCFPPA